MEFWGMFIIIVLVICIVGLLLRLLSLRASLGEIARELNDKLSTDTNTLISISSGDKAMRALAAEINRQLRSLRKERLELQHGDTELKNAVTNISHDLRTPLPTAAIAPHCSDKTACCDNSCYRTCRNCYSTKCPMPPRFSRSKNGWQNCRVKCESCLTVMLTALLMIETMKC